MLWDSQLSWHVLNYPPVLVLNSKLKVLKNIMLKFKCKKISKMQSLKSVILGDGNVGKTSMLMSYGGYSTYSPIYSTSVGFKDDSVINMNIWDTDGQEQSARKRLMSYPQTVSILSSSTLIFHYFSVTFWLLFGYFSVTFWLLFGYFLVTFRLPYRLCYYTLWVIIRIWFITHADSKLIL